MLLLVGLLVVLAALVKTWLGSMRVPEVVGYLVPGFGRAPTVRGGRGTPAPCTGARVYVVPGPGTVAENLRDDQEQDVLLLIDNIFRCAQAGAEVSGRRPRPGRSRALAPGSVQGPPAG